MFHWVQFLRTGRLRDTLIVHVAATFSRSVRVHHRPYQIWVISRLAGKRRFVPLRNRWVGVAWTFAAGWAATGV